MPQTLLDLLEDERNLPVIQFELDDGVEDGEDALARRRGRTSAWPALMVSVSAVIRFQRRAKQAGPIAETRNKYLAHPARPRRHPS